MKLMASGKKEPSAIMLHEEAQEYICLHNATMEKESLFAQ